MAVTPINSEDRLVQATFAEHLEKALGWESVYAWNQETFGPDGTLSRADTKEAVLSRDLRAALVRLNPELPQSAIDDAVRALTVNDMSRSIGTSEVRSCARHRLRQQTRIKPLSRCARAEADRSTHTELQPPR
jgi:hypothetical protein